MIRLMNKMWEVLFSLQTTFSLQTKTVRTNKHWFKAFYLRHLRTIIFRRLLMRSILAFLLSIPVLILVWKLLFPA